MPLVAGQGGQFYRFPVSHPVKLPSPHLISFLLLKNHDHLSLWWHIKT